MSGSLDRALFDKYVVRREIHSFARIFWAAHKNTPLGVGPSDNRFAISKSAYSVLYCGQTFLTAFSEVVIRDRFENFVGERLIPLREIQERVVARISSRPGYPLRLLDLREGNCAALGIPTDVSRARVHTAGQILGQRIYEHHHKQIDGFLFQSRLTGEEVVAVYDGGVYEGAIQRLLVSPKVPAPPMADDPDLHAALEHYYIKALIVS